MKILVCVKQVPDMESAFKVNAAGTAYDEYGLVFRMNRYDEFAVEEAVRIKEKLGNITITAISVGPARCEAVVRRAMEYGADHGVHVIAERALDAMEIASYIAFYAKEKSYDLLLFGVMAEDDQRCQVGPMTAALLDMPCATTVVKESIEGCHITVERELEGGRRTVVEMPLPAVVTVQSGINTPRYPSLSNKLRARKQELEIIDASSLPEMNKCEQLVRAYLPPEIGGAVFIQGSIEQQAGQLLRIIHEKTNVL